MQTAREAPARVGGWPRRALIAAACAVVGLAWAAPVGAQEASEGPVVDQEALYNAGFAWMGRGDWRRAAQVFRRCAEAKGPRTEFCEELARQSDIIASKRVTDRPESGRTELMIYSAGFGIWTGAAIGLAAEWETSTLLLAGLGGLGGLGAAYIVSDDDVIGVTPGEAALVTMGGNIGVWNGVAGLLIATDEAFDDSSDILLPLATGYVGIGVATLAFPYDPSAGDVALANAGALWGTFFSGMGLLIAKPEDPTTALVFGTLLLGTDGGLLAGAGLATQYDMSRSRVRFMNLGGTLGTLLVGGGLLALEVDNVRAVGASLAAGALGGGALSLWLTRSFDGDDREDPSAHLQLDAPGPFLRPHEGRGGESGWAGGVNLLQGRF